MGRAAAAARPTTGMTKQSPANQTAHTTHHILTIIQFSEQHIHWRVLRRCWRHWRSAHKDNTFHRYIPLVSYWIHPLLNACTCITSTDHEKITSGVQGARRWGGQGQARCGKHPPSKHVWRMAYITHSITKVVTCLFDIQGRIPEDFFG